MITPNQLVYAIALLLCLGTSRLMASHIIGGEITYTCTGHNSNKTKVGFDVKLQIYRDQSGIAFDPTVDIGVFELNALGEWVSHEVRASIPIQGIEYLSSPSDICKDGHLNDIEIELGVYLFHIDLEVIDYPYKIVYQKCCRNNSISNIKDPNSTGAAYEATLSPIVQKLGNDSPVFKDFPPTFICANAALKYDHSALDSDEDVLIYSFYQPFAAGGVLPVSPNCCQCQNPDPGYCNPPYPKVEYNPPYSYTNPLGGMPIFSIDSLTGIITGTPNTLGSFVVGLCVEEYRDQQLINISRRDFEFNVTNCIPQLEASIISDTVLTISNNNELKDLHIINSCELSNISIINNTSQEQFIDSYYWELYTKDGTIFWVSDSEGNRDITFDSPADSYINGIMVVKNDESCHDTAFFRVNLPIITKPKFSYNYDPCEFGEVVFENITDLEATLVEQWNWKIEDKIFTDAEKVSYQFPSPNSYQVSLLAIDDDGCIFSHDEIIDWFPNVNEPGHSHLVVDIDLCDNDSIYINEIWAYTTMVIADTILSESHHCDSIYIDYAITLHDPPIYESLDTTFCFQDSILLDGIWIKQEGSYEHVITSETSNCDSIFKHYFVFITKDPMYIETDSTICFGESVLFQGKLKDKEGFYTESVKFVSSHCDSVQYGLNLKVSPPAIRIQIDTSICQGDQLAMGDTTIFSAGQYIFSQRFQSFTCDSISTIVNVTEIDAPMLKSPNEYIIPYGTYIEIELEFDLPVSDIEWEPSEALSCNDCFNPVVYIKKEEEIFFTAFNQECSSRQSILFKIDDLGFYIPNIINRRDLENSRLFVQCNSKYSFTYDMIIYDRWGNNIFDETNLEVNDTNYGWGAYNLNPGIYIYLIVIKDQDLAIRMVGDITVL